LRLDRPHYTITLPTTGQHPWKKTTYKEKTWSTVELHQNTKKIRKAR
jgi:hypothetical protein